MIEEIKALKVAADEVLVLHFPENAFPIVMPDDPFNPLDHLLEALRHAGLEDRCVVIVADVEMAVVRK